MGVKQSVRAATGPVRAGAAALVSTFAVAIATTATVAAAEGATATASPATAPVAAVGTKTGSKAAGGAALVYDAADVTADTKDNSLTFLDIVATWRDIKVRADHAHASGIDTENNKWTFDGNVRIHSDRGDLHSDRAVVELKNNEVTQATVTGSPAEFEQANDNADRQVLGHAGEIVYNVADQLLRLSDDAMLTIGQSNIDAPQITYNILTRTAKAAKQPGTDGRVHGTIPPRQKDPQKDNDSKP